MRRSVRRGIGVGALLVGLAMILTLALVFAVRAGWERERVRAFAEAWVSDAVGDAVSFESIEGPLWPELSLHDIRWQDEALAVHVVRVDLRWSLDGWPPRRLTLERLHLAEPSVTFREAPAGDADPAAAGTSDAGAAAAVTVSLLHGTLEGGRLLGTAAGPLRVDGTIEGLVLAGDRALPERFEFVAVSPGALPRLAGAIRRETDGPVTAHLDWRAPGAAVDVGATLDPAPWLAGRDAVPVEIESEIGRLDLAELLERPELVTALAGHLEGTGELDLADPEASSLRATLQLAAPEPAALTHVAAELDWARNAWSLARLEARGSALEVEGAGRGNVDTIETLSLHLEVPRLEHWLAARDAPLSGRLVADARLHGAFDAPEGQVSVAGSALRFAGADDPSTATIRIEGNGERFAIREASVSGSYGTLAIEPTEIVLVPDAVLRFDRLDLTGPGGRVHASGAFDAETLALDDVAVETEGWDLGAIGAMSGLDWLAGSLSGHVRLDGALARPEVSGRVILAATEGTVRAEGALSDGLLADVRVEIEALGLAQFAEPIGAELPGVVDGELRVSGMLEQPTLTGTLDWRDGAATAHWDGSLAGGRFGESRLRLADVDLATLVPADLTPAPLAGRLAADLSFRGPIAAPEVGGTVDWTVPDAKGEAHALHARLGGGEDVLRADGAISQGDVELATFELSARLPLGPETLRDRDFVAKVDADGLELALARPFLPGFLQDPQGRLSGRASIRGGDPTPEVTGRLELSDGALRVAALGQHFRPIRAALSFANDAVEIGSFRAGPPADALSGSGRLTLDGTAVSDVSLEVGLEHFALSRTPALHADVSGNAELGGPPDALRLRGEFVLENARIAPPKADDPLMREIRIQGLGSARSEIEDTGASGSDLDIDLAVTVPPGTWVRGEGAELEVAGKLRYAQPRGEDPSYSGTLRTIRGTYRLQGRTLTVDRGTLSLGGQSEFDPDLDVAASARISSYILRVLLSGRLSNPQVDLSSDPPLPQSDVIALLVLGRTTAGLDRAKSSGIDGIVAGMGASLAVNQLRALVGDHLPFDTADVEVGDDGAPARVQVGRYVGEKLFIRYGRSLGRDAEDQIEVEWKLGPNLRVESSASASGEAGADLIWSVDY